MKPPVLFVITGDPRLSARPAEALRIASGVGAWEGVEITICLRGAAVLALSAEPDEHELLDAEEYGRYLPLVRAAGRPICVRKGELLPAKIGEPSLPFREITDEELAAQAAGSQYVIHF